MRRYSSILFIALFSIIWTGWIWTDSTHAAGAAGRGHFYVIGMGPGGDHVPMSVSQTASQWAHRAYPWGAIYDSLSKSVV